MKVKKNHFAILLRDRNVFNLFTELVEQRGLKVILDILDRLGGWPAVKGDSWDEESWTWQKAVVDCRKNGYSNDYFIDFSVGTDLKNSSTKIVDVR